MNFVRLLPVIFSMLLLAAHFSRNQHDILAVLCIGLITLLFIKKSWIPRLFQILLILGALEWAGTTIQLVQVRMAQHMPWIRLIIILLSVALFTGLSALVFRMKALRQRYEKS